MLYHVSNLKHTPTSNTHINRNQQLPKILKFPNYRFHKVKDFGEHSSKQILIPPKGL